MKNLTIGLCIVAALMFFLSGYILGFGQNLQGGYQTVQEVQLDNN